MTNTKTAETMTWQERQGRKMCEVRSTKQLITDFINTGYMDNENVPTVRGWIMDELKKRNPEAYDAWLDDETAEDRDLRKYYGVA